MTMDHKQTASASPFFGAVLAAQCAAVFLAWMVSIAETIALRLDSYDFLGLNILATSAVAAWVAMAKAPRGLALILLRVPASPGPWRLGAAACALGLAQTVGSALAWVLGGPTVGADALDVQQAGMLSSPLFALIGLSVAACLWMAAFRTPPALHTSGATEPSLIPLPNLMSEAGQRCRGALVLWLRNFPTWLSLLARGKLDSRQTLVWAGAVVGYLALFVAPLVTPGSFYRYAIVIAWGFWAYHVCDASAKRDMASSDPTEARRGLISMKITNVAAIVLLVVSTLTSLIGDLGHYFSH